MDIPQLRQKAIDILDGFSFNKSKFAQDCRVLCDLSVQLDLALIAERKKNAVLTGKLEVAEARLSSSSKDTQSAPSDFPSEMGSMFDQVFGKPYKGT